MILFHVGDNIHKSGFQWILGFMVTLADLHLEDIVIVVQGSQIETVKKPHVVDDNKSWAIWYMLKLTEFFWNMYYLS